MLYLLVALCKVCERASAFLHLWQDESRWEREIARLQAAAAADLEMIRKEAAETADREGRMLRYNANLQLLLLLLLLLAGWLAYMVNLESIILRLTLCYSTLQHTTSVGKL